MESRTNSALFKRAEQLRRWEESETNREPATARIISRRIQFSDGCVFLSACAAGDKEEVVKLLEQGADIDTPNVDGLTALHQACIDDNLDMVEFLVEQGADINRGDHEGWTPLHATASCGFLSIARYLIEHNADVAAVNNDGELPIDIAETEAMEELLEKETQDRGIDCDAARSQEERQMFADIGRWLDGDSASGRLVQPHPRTGATALHVASAKGYIRVMSMLVQGGAELNTQDVDGWTPLHASAHWGQREACQLLCENMVDMDIRNYVGQTCFDVADPDIIRLLEECKKRQAIILRERPDIWNNRNTAKNSQTSRRPVTRLPQHEKVTVQISSKISVPEKTQTTIVTTGAADEEKENTKEQRAAVENVSDDTPKTVVHPTNQRSDPAKDNHNKPVMPSSGPPSRPPPPTSDSGIRNVESAPTSPTHSVVGQVVSNEEEVPSWRRPGSFRARHTTNGPSAITSSSSGKEGLNRSISQPLTSTAATPVTATVVSASSTSALAADTEVTLRRAHSFESDERFYSRLVELRRRIEATSLTITQSNNLNSNNPQDDARRVTSRISADIPAEQTTTATLVLSQPNVQASVNQPVRRSFVPPVRDEESETQRKAHAKRVRETRRSTQGVTLEEVKSAEQLAKRKHAETFSLEDSRAKNNGASVNVVSTAAETTVTIPLRRTKTQEEEAKESTATAAGTPATIQRRRRPKRRSTGVVQIDMEDIDPSGKDSSSQPGDSEAQSDDSESLSDRGSSSRQVSRPSSLGSSISDIRDENVGTPATTPTTPITAHPVAAAAAALASGAMNANGEIDYKKLWEESQVENERLRDRLRTTHEDLTKCKDQLDNAFQVSNARNAMTEAEKRERRALERKLSEMEEELKESNKIAELLRSDISKMRDENGALIRVISKLSK